MKIACFIFTVWILCACQTSVEKEVTMDELSKPSVRYHSDNETTRKAFVSMLVFDSISYFSKQLVDTLGIPKPGVHRISTLLFPDRFNPVKSDKWYGITASDSFVYKHWMYADSNVAENTYYNWLDNFGDKHLSLKFGDKVCVSPNAFVLLLQHHSILLVETKKQLEKEKIINLLDTLGFGNTWKFVLFQNKGKKTEWFEQLTLTTKNENSKP